MPRSKIATDSNIEQSITGAVKPNQSYSTPEIGGTMETFERNQELINSLSKTGNKQVVEAENNRIRWLGSGVGTAGATIFTIAAANSWNPLGLALGGIAAIFGLVTLLNNAVNPKKVDENSRDMLDAIQAAQKANSKIATAAVKSEEDLQLKQVESDTELGKQVVSSTANIVSEAIKTREIDQLTKQREEIADHVDTYDNISSQTQRILNNLPILNNLKSVGTRLRGERKY